MHLSSRSVRRFAVVATTVGLTAPLAGVSASVAGQVAAPPPVPTLAWAPCEEGETLECTTATVPLDYDDPDGATIELALARVPASDPANRIGTLFLNPGVPAVRASSSSPASAPPSTLDSRVGSTSSASTPRAWPARTRSTASGRPTS